MPPAFSERERARITDLLLESGRTLFTTRGLRRTSLEELVAPAGIAKSSFYAFFDSKEALYLELMLRRMSAVKRRVIDEALTSVDGTEEALRRFLRATLEVLDTDPLYRRLMTHPEEMDAVLRRADPEVIAGFPDNPVNALNAFVAAGLAKGDLVSADPAAIVGVLQSVMLLPMNADRLADPSAYDRTVDLMIDVVARGLAARRE
ncbi:TetR/AcrR family transcriptional regulator [Nocardiopsis lambiniae]|uniref:TetR/AcrR family transcriptional regulator n=1 Tax=Nocardiopsis lambiniae TaxID=3075539 RepID=A0ABU2M8M6_9ACTN|nr:TetR/AcrR family transcriptional regulator [Nocardiopsis sp. DSM 44743]MDT0328601.1 TetR/AcrR family transcriptional regulator [Nocardiopsis sp. DSM 44743]